MTVRLTVDRNQWEAHVKAAMADYGDGLVPVVKGNGYGFGRPLLHRVVTERVVTERVVAGQVATEQVATQHGVARHDVALVCVGTVHELVDVPAALTPVVLTPTLTAPLATRPILTVGSIEHARALAGWQGSVIVKLASSMRRYGVGPAALPELLAEIEKVGLRIAGFGLHLPLASNDDNRLAEIQAWLPLVPATAELWVSHLRPESFRALITNYPTRRFRIRVGTALWHGIPRLEFITLTADVMQTQPVRTGEPAGYHQTPVPFDGTLVAISAGSTHGIAPLDDAEPARRSPFHFLRQRLTLLERPHMHTSLAIVPHGQPCPRVGDWVDVQRPLISTQVDELRWT